jgi:DNA-directed RNA polymerase subunit K/omega
MSDTEDIGSIDNKNVDSDVESVGSDIQQPINNDDLSLEDPDILNDTVDKDADDNALGDDAELDEKKNIDSDIDSDKDINSDKESDNEEQVEYGELLDEDIKDEKCYQKEAKKKKFVVEDKNLIIESNKWNEYTIVEKKNRITGKRMTKYEYCRLIGVRTVQLEKGAPPLIEVPKNIQNHQDIARLELYNKVSPFIIRRPLPGNLLEDWLIEEMEIYVDNVVDKIL